MLEYILYTAVINQSLPSSGMHINTIMNKYNIHVILITVHVKNI